MDIESDYSTEIFTLKEIIERNFQEYYSQA